MAQLNDGGGKYAGSTKGVKPTTSSYSGGRFGLNIPAMAPPNVDIGSPLPAQTRPATSPSAGQGLGVNSSGTVADVGGGQQAAATPMSNDAWWNSDAAYQTEQAGLGQTKQSALDSLKNKRTSYDSDFITALRNMGYKWGGATGNSLDGLDQGSFDPQNQLGAYGRGFQDLQNDYAGRGMMDSSFYDTAQRNFNTDYQNQFANLGTQRTNFNQDLTTQEQAALNEYQNALERAKQSSLARKTIAGV